MLRYSLASLLLILVYASIGCAALVNANGIWPQLAVTMSVVMLLVFTLAAIFWQGTSRAFAIGFSVSGWIYFFLVFTSLIGNRSYLLTDSSVDKLYVTIHAEQAHLPTSPAYSYAPAAPFRQVVTVVPPNPPPTLATAATPILPNPAPPKPAVVPASYSFYAAPAPTQFVDHRSFSNIGHSLWTVIVACLGGVVAQLLARRRDANAAQVVEPASS